MLAMSFLPHFFILCLFSAFSFTTFVSPSPASAPSLFPRQLTLTPPSQDPFYRPPAGYESQPLGGILRYRTIENPPGLAALAAGALNQTWQILYRSTSSTGEPNAVVTTLFVPTNGNTERLFSYQIAYDSAFVDCSPSYTMRSVTGTSVDFAAIALGLDQGWFVSTSDYGSSSTVEGSSNLVMLADENMNIEGFNAAFADGIQAGRALLDSLRAVKNSSKFTSLSPATLITLNGGSGGALASEWALELQQSYAPDVSIAGATLGSLTPNVSEVYNTVNGGPFAGLNPSGIIGLANQWQNLSQYLDTHLVASTEVSFRKASSQCLMQDQEQFALQNISLYFKNADFLNDAVPEWTINSVGVMGLHGTPRVPTYIYKGYGDEVSMVQDTDALVKKYCAQGAKITYIRNTATGHEGESILGIVGAFLFLQARFAQVPVSPGCTYVNITKTSLDATDEKILGPKISNAVNNALANLNSILD